MSFIEETIPYGQPNCKTVIYLSVPFKSNPVIKVVET